MSLIEDYVEFEATLNEFTWDKARKSNQTVPPMVPCSVDDFYPPQYPLWKDSWPYIAPLIMCVPKSSEITLWGNYHAVDFMSLDIRLKRYTNKPTCKNETEINDFIDENGQIFMFTNKVMYSSEIYTEEVLLKNW